jgi:hypothetical protein
MMELQIPAVTVTKITAKTAGPLAFPDAALGLRRIRLNGVIRDWDLGSLFLFPIPHDEEPSLGSRVGDYLSADASPSV